MDFEIDWEDEEFGREYLKFDSKYNNGEELLYSKPYIPQVLIVEIDYKTIETFTNQWNKKRKRVKVNLIKPAHCHPFRDSDEIEEGNYYLDMGARLFNATKVAYMNGWKYTRILKVSNENDKFDTEYYPSEYKLKIQTKIDNKLPAKKPAKNSPKKKK